MSKLFKHISFVMDRAFPRKAIIWLKPKMTVWTCLSEMKEHAIFSWSWTRTKQELKMCPFFHLWLPARTADYLSMINKSIAKSHPNNFFEVFSRSIVRHPLCGMRRRANVKERGHGSITLKCHSARTEKFNTVVGETLTLFSMPQIWKTGQCLAGQVGKTFLEFFSRNEFVNSKLKNIQKLYLTVLF